MRVVIPDRSQFALEWELLCQYLKDRGIEVRICQPPYLFYGDERVEIEVVSFPNWLAGLALPAGIVEASVSRHGGHGYVSENSCWSNRRQPWDPKGGKKVMKITFASSDNSYSLKMPVWIFNGLPEKHEEILTQWLLDNLPQELIFNR